jgi:peptidoglycan hydrolase-like protein with peptidoglycan-binding domain
MKKQFILQENMRRFKTKNLSYINEDISTLDLKINNVLPGYNDWNSKIENGIINIYRGDELMGMVTPLENDLFKVNVSKEWDSALGLRKYDPTLKVNGLMPDEQETLSWIKNNFGKAPKLDIQTEPETDSGLDKVNTGEEIYEPEASGGFCKRNLNMDWYFDALMTGKNYLKTGDCGEAVEVAQEHVNEFATGEAGAVSDITPLVVDGMYGPKTKKHVKRVQDFLNLKPDGLFGQKTHEALLKAIKSGESLQIDLDPIAAKSIENPTLPLRTIAPVTSADTNQFKQDVISNKNKRRKNRIGRLRRKLSKLTK